MNDEDVQNVNVDLTSGNCFDCLLNFYEEDGITPKDVSDWVLESQIRDLYDSSIILESFNFSQAGYSNYQWMMSLTAAQTTALPITGATNPGVKNIRTFSYDIIATIDDGCVYTIAQGAVYLNPAVTK